MSSWFVFSERELDEIEAAVDARLADPATRALVRETVAEIRADRQTLDHTFVYKGTGRMAVILTGAFGKSPRRIAPDPPMDTRPFPEAFE